MEGKKNFEKLKHILSSLDQGLVIKKDEPDYYYLNTNKKIKNKEMFFGAVQIRKSYVAYHLFPVYTNPEILDEISDGLKKECRANLASTLRKKYRKNTSMN